MSAYKVISAVKGYKEASNFVKVISVLNKATPNLANSILGVKAAISEATGGFEKLKAAGTSTFKGIGSLISAHPFIAIITAITTIYTIWKKVDEHFGISLKESKNRYALRE